MICENVIRNQVLRSGRTDNGLHGTEIQIGLPIASEIQRSNGVRARTIGCRDVIEKDLMRKWQHFPIGEVVA